MKTANVFKYSCCFALLALVVAAGCGRRPYGKNLYLIQAKRPQDSTQPQRKQILQVRQFAIDPAFASRGLVYRTGIVEYDVDYYNEFLVPPAANITENVRNWFAASQFFDVPAEADAGRMPPDFQIRGSVTEFYADLRQEQSAQAIMAMRVFVLSAGGTENRFVIAKEYRASSPLQSRTAEAVVIAHQQSLEQILADLEADLQEAATARDSN